MGMLTYIFSQDWIKGITIIFLILITILCILSPDFFFLRSGINYAVHFTIIQFILGLLFLFVRQPRLTFISYGCCAILCLFLKYNSDFTIAAPRINNESILSVAHFNLANSDEDPNVTFATMHNCGADLISIQEVTPLWDSILHENLKIAFPYQFRLVDIGIYGMAVYSRYPFIDLDTFRYRQIPNIIGAVNVPTSEKSINFIISHTSPAFNVADYHHLKKHLDLIASYCEGVEEPIITLGDYNAVLWSNEIQNFREKSLLNDSRRGFRTAAASEMFLEIPEDYIFFSDHFNCLQFETLTSETSNHLGIKGTYQFRSLPSYGKRNISQSNQ